jgi:hypothetical protein
MPRSGGSAGKPPSGPSGLPLGRSPGRSGHAGRVPPLDPQARRELIDRLRRDGRRIAARFELEYEGIDPENARVKRRYGSCHSDGRIKIRLTHVRTGRPLKYSSMVDTLCHELAHLKHFNHGPRFKAFYFQILDWAREQGIYSPGPDPARALSGAPGGRAGHAGSERITAAPPGLWGQVEALARNLRTQEGLRSGQVAPHAGQVAPHAGQAAPHAGQVAPPRVPAPRPAAHSGAAPEPAQLGLFDEPDCTPWNI